MTNLFTGTLAFREAFRPQNADRIDVPAACTESIEAPALPAITQSRETEAAIEHSTHLWQDGHVFKSDLVAGYPRTHGNSIELFVNGSKAFPELFRDIDQASSSIHISYYIFESDALGRQFIDKLIAAHQRGVEVRVEMDGIGSKHIVPFSLGRRAAAVLEEAGIQVIRNYPISAERLEVFNNPDHRKICVIDGRIAYSGGMNMAQAYVNDIHDVMVRMQGNIVQQIQSEWINSWLHLGGTIGEDLASDGEAFQRRYFPPTAKLEGAAETSSIRLLQTIPGLHDQVYKADLDLINGAKESLYLEFPYLTADSIETALAAAAKRGVDVHIILPAKNDNRVADRLARDEYANLIRAGCKIYDYPGFCHGKVLLADRTKVKIGTSNLDPLSLHKIYEIDFLVEDQEFSRTCHQKIFERDISVSRRVEARGSGFMARTIDKMLWLLTPLS